MPKTLIFRRKFNPQNKDEKNVNELVATFAKGSEKEAAFFFNHIHAESTTFSNFSAHASPFAEYRYTVQEIYVKKAKKMNLADLQVETNNAKPTKRPIAYTLSWEIHHGKCHILAFHPLYGTVRGEIENSVEGRQMFTKRVAYVWPNAEIKK